jgi:2-oxoglutarate dehydrogenase E1 component
MGNRRMEEEGMLAELGDPAADAVRRWGHLAARIDPLGRIPRTLHPALQAAGPRAARILPAYTGALAVEFMHVPFPERCRWIAQQMESPAPPVDRDALLDLLARGEAFEQVLQSHYVGTKRFSLEGMTSLLPLLDRAVRTAAASGATRAVLGMSHRGRLNVIVNLLGRPAREIFARFEDDSPDSVMGGGDVKYHLGAAGEFHEASGRSVALDLVANPSHLEAVDPIVEGTARAVQDRVGPEGPRRVLPLLLHGDAAIAGQGIASETFNLSELPGYTVRGTVHVVLNNLIGFTTEPASLYSSRYATDVAHRLAIPVFHVSAEAPEEVVRAARIVTEYRDLFCSDVVLDLVGYRRHGHSEVDDPTTTQPALYRRIAALKPTWRAYGESLGKSAAELDALGAAARTGYERELEAARDLDAIPPLEHASPWWSEFTGGPYDPGAEVSTAVPGETLSDLGRRLTRVPEGFNVHPKVAQLLASRGEMALGRKPVDWAMAEALALASLLAEGIGGRLSGQDTRRGTFNQRHAVLVDVQTGREIVPLNRLWPDQKEFLEVIDTPLSEAAPLGFEYGYSRAFPERLVAWEAQFGDFANGAQILIDQFLSAAEDKWGHRSGLVLLLPHGFEGQGPEHSHARPERFLQLAARDSLQVCQPSTAAQYFHLLRRQMLRRWRKPLVVFTPKMMLRHPASASPLSAFSDEEFDRVRVARAPEGARRIFVCTGKVLHDLAREGDRRGRVDDALLSVEELAPVPEPELAEAFGRFPGAREIIWVQEEPANMGALAHLMPVFERLRGGRALRAVSRPASGSPATGSGAAHAREQEELLQRALGNAATAQ